MTDATPPSHNAKGRELRGEKVQTRKLGLGVWLLYSVGLFSFLPNKTLKGYIFVLTFVCYAAYHMSRKPFSVVAAVLAPNCSIIEVELSSETTNASRVMVARSVDPWEYEAGWPPFNGTHCKTVIGAVDYTWLFTYAVCLFISGLVGDRVNVRYFLTVGMLGSGVTVGLLGVAYFLEVHNLAYFVVVQMFVGVFESTGWPGVVAVMGNWFGKQNRGLVMGIWNAHTSVGNILGTAVPSIWAREGQPWAWSFLVPAFVMIVVGSIIFLFLIVDPSHIGLPPPIHHLEIKASETNGQPSHCSKRSPSSIPVDSETCYCSSDAKNVCAVDDQPITDTSKLLRGMSNKQYSKSDSSSDHSEAERQPTTDLTEQDSSKQTKKKAISLIGALRVPGVIEYSISLFFAKLVAYTFLFWLPYYLTYHPIGDAYLGNQNADLLATLYDVGGIIGGIITGLISDLLSARAISCVLMMYLAVPTLFIYRSIGHDSLELAIFLIILCGLFINGPYALITTAVSSDLGTHKNLKENQQAKATVGAIIDGTGSFGAACGPLITGWVSDDFGWDQVFYVLMVSCFLSSLMLTRLLITELKFLYCKLKCFCRKKCVTNNSLDDQQNLLREDVLSESEV